MANIATLNPLSARFFPDFNGVSSEELVADAQSKIDRWIKLLNTTKSNWDAEKQRRSELLKLNQSESSQSINGTYINEAGQKLIIKNNRKCCFDYEVTWGVDDEWDCLFSDEGEAKYIDSKSAYSGEDPDWSFIDFTINLDSIDITGGLDYIGDCAKYGDSQSETYSLFKKE